MAGKIWTNILLKPKEYGRMCYGKPVDFSIKGIVNSMNHAFQTQVQK